MQTYLSKAPELPEPIDARASEVEAAIGNFFNNTSKVFPLHDRLLELAEFAGVDKKYDEALADAITGHRQLLSDMGLAFSEIHPLLNETQSELLSSWLRNATTQVKRIREQTGLGALGVAPVIIIGGVVISAIVAGIVVNFARNIELQKKRLEYQEQLLPLVEGGIVPPEILEPPPESPGILGGVLGSVKDLILIGVGVMIFLPMVQDAFKKKS